LALREALLEATSAKRVRINPRARGKLRRPEPVTRPERPAVPEARPTDATLIVSGPPHLNCQPPINCPHER
ncbi:MAG: hypothetical protein ACI9WU_005102, partial [Myxococcota bacterium]